MLKQKKVTSSFPPVGRGGSAKPFVTVTLILASLPQALAGQAADGSLTVKSAWFRTVVPGRPAGGYFMLSNDGDRPRKLVGAASTACGSASLHETREEGGVAKMLPVDQIDVPAHGSITFAPGRYHVMCMKPSDAVKPGNTVPLTLKFADGAELATDFVVKSVAGN